MHIKNKLMTIGLGMVAAGFVLASASAQAQIIWGAAQNITADTDVSTAGTFVQAFNVNAATNGATTVVNGVTFTSVDLAHQGTAGFANEQAAGAYGGGSGLSTNYQSLMSYIYYTYIPNTLTLSGLNPGDTYALELWAQYSGGGANGHQEATIATDTNSVSLLWNQSASAGANGQYAIGDFVAGSSPEVISFSEPASTGGDNVVNAYELRDLTVSGAPEPSTVGMFGLGAIAILFVIRRLRSVSIV